MYAVCTGVSSAIISSRLSLSSLADHLESCSLDHMHVTLVPHLLQMHTLLSSVASTAVSGPGLGAS